MLKQSVTPQLVEHYFDLLSTACRQRNRLFSSYHHVYQNLVEWDSNIVNYSQGLLLLSGEADDYIQDTIAESVLNKGDFFTIALFALALRRDDYLHALLTLACSVVDYDEAIRDIILWAPEHSVLWTILGDYPVYYARALTLRQDISLHAEIDLRFLSAVKPSAITVESLAAIHLYNPDRYFSVIEWLLDANDAARVVAIESLLDSRTFYSHKLAIQDALYQLTQSPDQRIAQKAAELTIFKSPLAIDDYLAFIRHHLRNPRLYIQALGWYGSARAIPELTEYLHATELARLSGAALYTITGASPEKEGWVADAPAPQRYALPRDMNGFVPDDPDSGLSWPDSAAFSRWWGQHHGDFAAHQCYLAGKNVRDARGLASVVLTQSLRLSSLAALRLAQAAPRLPVLLRLPAYAGAPRQLTDSLTI